MSRQNHDLNFDQYFDNIVEHIHDLYDFALTDKDAKKAAHNLVGFVQTLLEIQSEICQHDG